MITGIDIEVDLGIEYHAYIVKLKCGHTVNVMWYPDTKVPDINCYECKAKLKVKK